MTASGEKVVTALRFLWWNTQDFAHYDHTRRRTERWPRTRGEFDEKCRRVGAALKAAALQLGEIHLVALGEVTCRAAQALRDYALPGYAVHSLDLDGDRPSLEVAWLTAPGLAVEEQMPIVAPDLPRATRKMPVLDFLGGGVRVRFVACHWPAFDEARANRERIADHLNHELYEFLVKQREPGVERHAVVLGDLNEEPFGTPQTRLLAHRARDSARSAAAWQDHDVRRVHLYNAAWRLLGERWPHGEAPPANAIDAAGTYYAEKERRWVTFDHVIVSAGLLGPAPPRLDEAAVQVVAARACAPDGGRPGKFVAKGGTFSGVSDHLPVAGRILLGD